jgi:hypothetical protein
MGLCPKEGKNTILFDKCPILGLKIGDYPAQDDPFNALNLYF